MKKKLSSSNAPAAIGPYSPGIDTGNIVWLSGQIPIDPATGEFPSDDIGELTAQCFKNISALLAEAGLTLADVVRVDVFLADIADFAAVNAVYATFFEEPYPARSCYQVAALPKKAKIEIEVTAVRS